MARGRNPDLIAQQLLQGQRADIAPTTGFVPQPQLRPQQQGAALLAPQPVQRPQQEITTAAELLEGPNTGRSLIARNLLEFSNDRSRNPIARGLAAFVGSKTLREQGELEGAERRSAADAKRAAAEAATIQQERENVLAEREVSLKERAGETAREVGLFNKERQATQDTLLQTERTRKADLDERRIRLSEDAATQKITAAQQIKEQKKIDQEFELVDKDAAAEVSINLIDDLLEHPGLNAAVGFGAQKLIPFRTDELGQPEFAQGSEAADFQARFNQIKSETFLVGFNRLKGGGTITEAEGRKAESAISRMSLSQSEKEFKVAVGELRGIIDIGRKRATSKAKAKGVTIREALQQTPIPSGDIKFLGFE